MDDQLKGAVDDQLEDARSSKNAGASVFVVPGFLDGNLCIGNLKY